MAEVEAGWAALGFATPPGQKAIANGKSALLPTLRRGGETWLPAPRGSRGPTASAVSVLLARLDRGSWTPPECIEMHAAGGALLPR
jgi:hypothetical protein